MCQAALAVKYILIRWLDYQSGPQIPASVVMQLAPSRCRPTLAACRVQLGRTAAGPPCPRPVCDSDPATPPDSCSDRQLAYLFCNRGRLTRGDPGRRARGHRWQQEPYRSSSITAAIATLVHASGGDSAIVARPALGRRGRRRWPTAGPSLPALGGNRCSVHRGQAQIVASSSCLTPAHRQVIMSTARLQPKPPALPGWPA